MENYNAQVPSNYQQPVQAVQQPQAAYQQAAQAQPVYTQAQPVQAEQDAQQAQQVAIDPAYAQYIAMAKQAELQREADMRLMQAKFMDKVYNDPKRQQLNDQEAINGATLGVSGQTQDSQFGISMDEIMRARFNESTNSVQVNFKKTCLIKAYETEVVEGSATIELNGSMSGIERALAINIIEAQVEQAVNENVLAKGLVTHYEYEQKKNALIETVSKLREQAIALVGEEQVNKIFNM